ncbi:MAG: hypothetical protein ACI85U_001145, partial [Candidatus Promineifilaceae bacterium]
NRFLRGTNFNISKIPLAILHSQLAIGNLITNGQRTIKN